MPTKPKAEEAVAELEDNDQSHMTEFFRRMFLATIGAIAIAQEELEALVNRLVERGEMAEKDGKKLVQEMMDKRKSKTTKLEDELGKNVESVLNRMNIPSKADVEALSQDIAALSKKVDGLKKP